MDKKLNPFRKKAPPKSKPAEKPVSLAPLSFEDALKGLMKVKPAKKSRA